MLSAAQIDWLAYFLMPISESWTADVPAVCKFLQLLLWPEEAWLALSQLKIVNVFSIFLPIIVTKL